MATNPIVNSYGTVDEKRLMDDLVAESIQQRGFDFMYLPRVGGVMDEVYMENTTHRFEKAYTIEMYVESHEGFQGDQHFYDKFGGMHIADQILLSIASRTFNRVLRTEKIQRPREGDLIWDPLSKRCFEIKFVNKWKNFYPLGHLPMWEVRCELFEYSGQEFSVGIPELDGVNRLTNSLNDLSLNTEDGRALRTEDGRWWSLDDSSAEDVDPLDDSDRIQAEADAIIDFTETDPFSEGVY